MNWQIELYEKSNGKCPVLDYIQTLSPKQRARIEKEIDLLEMHGVYLPFPFKRKIRGCKYKDLWELRIKFGTNQFRIIYFLYMKNVFILLHAFCKKSQKTSKNELKIAKDRMADFLEKNKGVE